MTLKQLILAYLALVCFGLMVDMTTKQEHQLIIVAPIDNPKMVYYCNGITWRYGIKYATKCNVKKVFRFDDSRYLFGYEEVL